MASPPPAAGPSSFHSSEGELAYFPNPWFEWEGTGRRLLSPYHSPPPQTLANGVAAASLLTPSASPTSPPPIASPPSPPPQPAPGFAFCPSDRELVSYLRPRISGQPLPDATKQFFHEGDVYATDPASLVAGHLPGPAKAKGESKNWYFFSLVKPRSAQDSRKCRIVGGGKGTWKQERGNDVDDAEGHAIGRPLSQGRQVAGVAHDGVKRRSTRRWPAEAGSLPLQDLPEPAVPLQELRVRAQEEGAGRSPSPPFSDIPVRSCAQEQAPGGRIIRRQAASPVSPTKSPVARPVCFAPSCCTKTKSAGQRRRLGADSCGPRVELELGRAHLSLALLNDGSGTVSARIRPWKSVRLTEFLHTTAISEDVPLLYFFSYPRADSDSSQRLRSHQP